MWCASCGLSDPIDRKCILNASRLVVTALEPIKQGACAKKKKHSEEYQIQDVLYDSPKTPVVFLKNNPSLKREPNDSS